MREGGREKEVSERGGGREVKGETWWEGGEGE